MRLSCTRPKNVCRKNKKQVETERARFELDRDRLEFAFSLMDRLEDPAEREQAQRRLAEAFRQLMSGDRQEATARKRIRLALPDHKAGEDPGSDDIEAR